MTRRQRSIAVEWRAALLLADQPSVQAYAAHFESQMRRGTVRRLLFTSYLWVARAGTTLTRLARHLITTTGAGAT